MAFLTAASGSTLESVIQLIGIIVVFIIILIATYFTTRWLGASGFSGGRSKNFKVVETYKIAQNKYLQILKIGDKYVVISVCKDRIQYLTELNADSLIMEEDAGGQGQISFKEVMSKINDKYKKKE